MNVICICIIEDDEVIRKSYALLLQSNPRYKVTGSYPSVEDAKNGLEELDPDVILLDVNLPGINGIDGISVIKKLSPQAHILILTVFENEELIVKALRNGASGYLSKNSSPERIAAAIDEVMEGGAPMSSSVSSIVVRLFRKSTDSPLSARETQILESITAGKSRLKIARELFIDVETVKSHLKSIYAKLNVHSKEEAILVAKRKKLI